MTGRGLGVIRMSGEGGDDGEPSRGEGRPALYPTGAAYDREYMFWWRVAPARPDAIGGSAAWAQAETPKPKRRGLVHGAENTRAGAGAGGLMQHEAVSAERAPTRRMRHVVSTGGPCSARSRCTTGGC